VTLWTSDGERARAIEADGLSVYRGNPIEDATAGAPSELDGIEYALVVGDDQALCAMAATDLSEYFGRDRVFQLPVKDERAGDYLTRVPVLFDDSANHDELLARIEAGAEIAVAEGPTGANGETDVHARPGADGMPMFVLTPGKDLRVLMAGGEPELKAGQELVSLRGCR
jgi:hypothetical protein